jgi:plastocyanin
MMNRSSIFAMLLLLGIAGRAAPARAGESDAAALSPPPVTGQVVLRQSNSKSPLRDASKVVVWLVPADGARPVSLSNPNTPYRIVQHDKRFEPDLLVVPVGTQVEFPNLDPWFHSVFSLYDGKRFDLGLYEAGSHKKVAFDRPGPSYIFCNIHPEMSAVVLAIESDYSAISDKAGRVSLENVPDGKYVLHVWYGNASQKDLDALERTVEIGAASRTLPALTIAVTAQRTLKHKNKYGHDYDPDVLEPLY